MTNTQNITYSKYRILLCQNGNHPTPAAIGMQQKWPNGCFWCLSLIIACSGCRARMGPLHSSTVCCCVTFTPKSKMHHTCGLCSRLIKYSSNTRVIPSLLSSFRGCGRLDTDWLLGQEPHQNDGHGFASKWSIAPFRSSYAVLAAGQSKLGRACHPTPRCPPAGLLPELSCHTGHCRGNQQLWKKQTPLRTKAVQAGLVGSAMSGQTAVSCEYPT